MTAGPSAPRHSQELCECRSPTAGCPLSHLTSLCLSFLQQVGPLPPLPFSLQSLSLSLSRPLSSLSPSFLLLLPLFSLFSVSFSPHLFLPFSLSAPFLSSCDKNFLCRSEWLPTHKLPASAAHILGTPAYTSMPDKLG